MNYKINGIPIRDYGINIVRDNSSFGISGFWDLPKRSGTSYRSWGNENGIEAYVESSDMTFDVRDFTLKCFIRTNDISILSQRLDTLYSRLKSNAQNPLIFEIPELNEIRKVYINKAIPINRNRFNGQFTINFTEFEPDFIGVLPPAINAQIGIDGISFQDLGIDGLTATSGQFDNPALKNLNLTKTDRRTTFAGEFYEARTIRLTALMKCAGLIDFNNKAKALQMLFSSPGLRRLKLPNIDMMTFAPNGFSITNPRLYRGNIFANFIIELMEAH